MLEYEFGGTSCWLEDSRDMILSFTGGSTDRFNPLRIAWLLATSVVASCLLVTDASAQFLRVVTYNIDADTGGADGDMGGVYSGPGLTTVLQAIGNAHLAGHAQPIDVLALQELNYSRTTTTLGFIVSQLNSIYGAGTYAYDTTLDPTTGDFTGNGPNGLVYNTLTVQVLGATPIGSASNSGAPRAPMRYKLAPKGYNDHSADFWLYVSHMKSGTPGSGSGSNGDRRNIEATTIRDDAYTVNDGLNGTTFNEVAHMIYTGDFNINDSSEAAYQTMISGSLHAGIMKAADTLNPANNWNTSGTTSSPFQGLFTESATYVQYRDDFQFLTGPMTNQAGMQLVPGSLTAFGNGGGIFHKAVNDLAANSAALTDLTPASYRTSVLNALTTTTDHLPVVADYSFATAVSAPGDYDHSGVVNIADYTVWRKQYGSAGTNLLADGNHDNVVNAADFSIWRKAAAGAGAWTLNAGSQVPEPAAWALVLVGCLASWRRSRLRA